MGNKHIAFLTPVAQKTEDELNKYLPNGFSLEVAANNDRTLHAKMLEKADYVFLGGTVLDSELIQNAPKLKFIQKWGIGVDKIAIETARNKNIPVAITNGSNASQVAEQAVLLMLTTLRKFPYARQSLLEGKWINSELRAICTQLTGKTVGLFGLGNIAKKVIQQLSGFNTTNIYYSRTRLESHLEKELKIRYVDFETLLKQSDILSLHAPLTDQTRNIINAHHLSLMKQDAIIINTARGELIDEEALTRAIASKELRGAGLDVFVNEPPNLNNPLLHLPEVVATPHAGASVIEAVTSIVKHGMKNIELYESGQELDPADWVVPPRSN